MRILKLIALFTIIFSVNGFAQKMLPIQYKIEKQSMSTPMSPLEDIFFSSSYYTKPLNIKFDGSLLYMYYDNGATFVKKNVTKVNSEEEYDGEELIMEKHYYTINDNISDTIMFVVDYEVEYVQIIVPAKKSNGDYWGYTSYLKFVKGNELALN